MAERRGGPNPNTVPAQGDLLYWTRQVGLIDSDVLGALADIGPAIQKMCDNGVGYCFWPIGQFLWNTPVYHTGQMPLRWYGSGSSQNAATGTTILLGSGLAGVDVDHCDIALRIHEVAGQGTTVRGVYEHTFGTEVGGTKNDETNQVIEGIRIGSTSAAQALAYLPSFLLSSDIGVSFRNVTFDHLLLGSAGVNYADGFSFDSCKFQNGKVGTDPTHVSVMFFQAGLGDNVRLTHNKGGNASPCYWLANARGADISGVGGATSGLLLRCLDFNIHNGHFDADDTSATTTEFNGFIESQGSQGAIRTHWWDAPWASLAHIVPFVTVNDLNANEPSDLLIDSCRGNITLDSTRAGTYRLGDINIKAIKQGTTLRLRRMGLNYSSGGPTTTQDAIGPYLTCGPSMTALAAQLIDPAFIAQLCSDIDLTSESSNQTTGTFVVRGAGNDARSISQLNLPTLSVAATSQCPNSLAGTMQRNYTVIGFDAAGRACGYVTADASASSSQSLQLTVGNLVTRSHALIVLSADGAGTGSQAAATRWCAISVGYDVSIPLIDNGVSLHGIPWITTGTIPKVTDYGLDLATRNWTTNAVLGKNGELRSPVTVVKPADATPVTANTTLATDPDLQLWLPVGKYKIEAIVDYSAEQSGTGSSGEIKFGWVTPTGKTGFWSQIANIASGTAVSASQNRTVNAWGSSQSLGGAGVGTAISATLIGELELTTAGVFALQWAQANSSAGATVVYARSMLTATPI